MTSRTFECIRRLAATGLLVQGLCADVPPERALFCADVEDIGAPFGLAAVASPRRAAAPPASPPTPDRLGSAPPPAGTYTRVPVPSHRLNPGYRHHRRQRQRRCRSGVSSARWDHGRCQTIVPFQIDGQAGCADRPVRRHRGPPSGQDVNPYPSPRDRLAAAAALPFAERPCRLAQFPPRQEAGPGTVLSEAFESPLPMRAAGRTEPGQGPWGPALLLGLPDGRYDLPLDETLRLADTGTVEWWVQPRPATNAWRDQGWRYFLHGQPASGTSVRLDLSRQVASGLTLSLSTTAGAPRQDLSLDVTSLDPEAWHHITKSPGTWLATRRPSGSWSMAKAGGCSSRSASPNAASSAWRSATLPWRRPALPAHGRRAGPDRGQPRAGPAPTRPVTACPRPEDLAGWPAVPGRPSALPTAAPHRPCPRRQRSLRPRRSTGVAQIPAWRYVLACTCSRR